jgi:hypothetical protein
MLNVECPQMPNAQCSLPKAGHSMYNAQQSISLAIALGLAQLGHER